MREVNNYFHLCQTIIIEMKRNNIKPNNFINERYFSIFNPLENMYIKHDLV